MITLALCLISQAQSNNTKNHDYIYSVMPKVSAFLKSDERTCFCQSERKLTLLHSKRPKLHTFLSNRTLLVLTLKRNCQSAQMRSVVTFDESIFTSDNFQCWSPVELRGCVEVEISVQH